MMFKKVYPFFLGKNTVNFISFSSPYYPTLEIVVCDGGDSCCTPDQPCGEGQGDCDGNDDCNTGLVCGNNNCMGSSFDSLDDCCSK